MRARAANMNQNKGPKWTGPPCPLCAWSTHGSRDGKDTANCCHLGGGWQGQCAQRRSGRRNFTFMDGYMACQNADKRQWQAIVDRPWPGPICSLCAGAGKPQTANCCHQGGSWQGRCANRRTIRRNFTFLDGHRACRNADKKEWEAAVKRYLAWKKDAASRGPKQKKQKKQKGLAARAPRARLVAVGDQANW